MNKIFLFIVIFILSNSALSLDSHNTSYYGNNFLKLIFVSASQAQIPISTFKPVRRDGPTTVEQAKASLFKNSQLDSIEGIYFVERENSYVALVKVRTGVYNLWTISSRNSNRNGTLDVNENVLKTANENVYIFQTYVYNLNNFQEAKIGNGKITIQGDSIKFSINPVCFSQGKCTSGFVGVANKIWPTGTKQLYTEVEKKPAPNSKVEPAKNLETQQNPDYNWLVLVLLAVIAFYIYTQRTSKKKPLKVVVDKEEGVINKPQKIVTKEEINSVEDLKPELQKKLSNSPLKKLAMDLHIRVKDIIKILRNIPESVKSKNQLLDYLHSTDRDLVSKMNKPNNDDPVILLAVFKDFFNWEGTAMSFRPPMDWLGSLVFTNNENFRDCSFSAHGWYHFKGFEIIFHMNNPKETLIYLTPNPVGDGPDDRGPEAEELFKQLNKLGGYKITKESFSQYGERKFKE